MKTFFIGLAAAIVLSGCTMFECKKNTSENSVAYVGKKLKAGYYIGDGSSGHGVYWLARLLHYSPQLETVLLDGKDIQNGKLDGLDILVVPGGDSWRQSDDIGEKGGEKIREFVRKGGAYWGICAGFHCALNKPDRLRLVPYTYIEGVRGYKADLAIDINKKGAEILGIRGGRYFVTYSNGPISKEINEWKHGKTETLAIYRSTVSSLGVPSNFMNAPALIYGNYGKGKVIATSFHPEMHRGNDPISMGCIYAVTGVRPTPVYPVKNYRPVRVAFAVGYTKGKTPIYQLLELDKEKDLDVTMLGEAELAKGILHHTDIVVFPDANPNGIKYTINKYMKELKDFLNNNGRIVAGEKLKGILPEHENITYIPSNSSFVKEALKRP